MPFLVQQNIGSIIVTKHKSSRLYTISWYIIIYCYFVFANNIAHMMGDSHLTPMIQAASLSFIFIGMLGVLRGYYQSANNMTVPAISRL